MIDTLVAMRQRIEAFDVAGEHSLEQGRYLVVTLHRPALVDGPGLAIALTELEAIAEAMPVLFPIHPRTRASMDAQGLQPRNPRLRLIEPVGYVEFLSLIASAAAVLTDSGGIQEETTYLGIPCFTLRDNTERPVTVELGTNTLLGLRPDRIREVPDLLDQADSTAKRIPPLWDGSAAERVVDVIGSQLPDISSLATSPG